MLLNTTIMNQFQKALTVALEVHSGGLEFISKGINRVRPIFRGKVYENYVDLPREARFAVARVLSSYPDVYNSLREKYDVLETEERMAWCFFGAFDGNIDILVDSPRKARIEIASHCQKCQYEKPFCCKTIANLTPRQQECFILMREGLTDKEVAMKLGISSCTVIKHMNNAVERFRDITGRRVTRQYIISQLQTAGL
jgi:predicted DNA-binding protein (UPF0251 family)